MAIEGRASPLIGKVPKTYGSGRTCSSEECNTRLSIYNKYDKCSLHQPRKSIRIRGRTPSEIMENENVVQSCEDCISRLGSVFDETSKVLVDGVVHVQGVGGKATFCEGW